MAFLFEDHRLEVLHERLLAFYGRPAERDMWDPLTQMIYSMLSSRTKTETSHEVLRDLRTKFGSWERLRDAPVAAIEDTIQAATFPERKAVQLKRGLEQALATSASVEDFMISKNLSRDWILQVRPTRAAVTS